MKKLSTITIYILITSFTFAQEINKTRIEKFYTKLNSNKSAVKWPSKSFYQRKGEWQHIIDSTWGPGLDVSKKREVFTHYVTDLEKEFPLFHRLGINYWDSLKNYWWNQITDSTSKGGFQAIMGYICYGLKDGHSVFWDTDIGGIPNERPHAQLYPGVPLFVFLHPYLVDPSYFGACLSANDNNEIIVFKVTNNHPLGLEPGDVILGYEGVKWLDLVKELFDAHIPLLGSSFTTEKAKNHQMLINAGLNWHLFSTIDIVKYSSGDTLHLSLEPMLQLNSEPLYHAEQLDIPGVPKPNILKGEQGSYGRIENTNVGLIYIYHHSDPDSVASTNEIFHEAIVNLFDTDGLIIDLRGDAGGSLYQNLNSGLNLLLNEPSDILNTVERCSYSDLLGLCDFNYPAWDNLAVDPDPNTFYDKPIAVLVGPTCGSSGDITAARLRSLPNARFFGKTTAGLFGDIAFPKTYEGYYYFYQYSDIYFSDKPHQYLSGTEFPVDQKVWLTKYDIALGEDTVVKEALKWINNLSYSCNAKVDKTYSNSQVNLTADVINPKGHELSVNAKISNGSIIVDSIDCKITNGKINEILDLSAYPEDLYSASILTEDKEDSTTYSLPNVVRFTNAGPVVLDTFSLIYQDSLIGISDIYLTNLSQSKKIPNVVAEIKSTDTNVISISTSKLAFYDILPNEKKKSGVDYIILKMKNNFTELKFLLEISSNKCSYWYDTLDVILTSVKNNNTNIPIVFELFQNYPNPFNLMTKISYSIPSQSHVSLKVFDVLGREVAILVNEEQKVGNYEVEFDGSKFTSGVYFYLLQAGNYVETKKMILLK